MSAASPRKKRQRLPSLLIKGVATAVAVAIWLPSAEGFGLSACGASSACAGVRSTSDGAVFSRGWSDSLGMERCCGQEGDRARKERERGGGGGTEGRRRGAHTITCKVASPRKYGSADWYSNILNLPKSRLLYNIRDHLIFNTSFAFLVSMIHFLSPQHVIDDLHVSPIPHSIMSGALGLLLVFRTNAAYNRFWEARKVWGSVTNTCRSLARLGAVALGPDSAEWQEMKEYLKMFPFLLKQHLQDDRIDEELEFSALPKEKIMRLQEDPNPPLFACQLMSEILAEGYAEGGTGQSTGGRVPDFTSVTYRMEIEHGLTSLIDYLGMCERILTTPVPRGYSRHTSRFLTVYGVTLPIVLVPHTELFTAPVVAAVCWGLFSIEEIAYFIEQPFDPEYKQLDLMAYANKIAGDVERLTSKSSLGRLGSSASPLLPATTAMGGGGGEVFLASLDHQNANNINNNINHGRHQEGWGRAMNGGRGGGGGGERTEDTLEVEVDEPQRVWRGGREDDIIG